MSRNEQIPCPSCRPAGWKWRFWRFLKKSCTHCKGERLVLRRLTFEEAMTALTQVASEHFPMAARITSRQMLGSGENEREDGRTNVTTQIEIVLPKSIKSRALRDPSRELYSHVRNEPQLNRAAREFRVRFTFHWPP